MQTLFAFHTSSVALVGAACRFWLFVHVTTKRLLQRDSTNRIINYFGLGTEKTMARDTLSQSGIIFLVVVGINGGKCVYVAVITYLATSAFNFLYSVHQKLEFSEVITHILLRV